MVTAVATLVTAITGFMITLRRIEVVRRQGNSREGALLKLSLIAHKALAERTKSPADIMMAEEIEQQYEAHREQQRTVT
jgi:hypothetical protein